MNFIFTHEFDLLNNKKKNFYINLKEHNSFNYF